MAVIMTMIPAAIFAQQQWYVETTPLPTGRQMYGGVVLGDHVYIIGGHMGAGGYTTSVVMAPILSNGAVGAWTETTPLPKPRSYIANSAIALNDVVYVVAGWDGTDGSAGYGNTILWTRPQADGALETWRESAPFPGPGTNCAVALATPGYIHLFGGQAGDKTILNTVWSARIGPDGAPLGWEPAPPLPVPLWFHCGGVAAGRVWIWGGLMNSGNTSTNQTVFTAVILSTGRLGPWQVATTAPLPQGYYSASSTVTGSYLMAFCPRYASGIDSNDVWYAVASPLGLSAWQKWPTTLPSKLYIGLATDYRRGFVYIPGGRRGKNDYVLDNKVYYFQLAAASQPATPAAVAAATDTAVTMASAPESGSAASPSATPSSASRLSYEQAQLTQGEHPGFVPFEQARQLAQQRRMPMVAYFFNAKARRCQEQKAILETFNATAFQGRVLLAEVDTAKFPQLTQQYGVFRIPHWIIFDAAGNTMMSQSGVLTAQDLATQALRVAP